MAMLLATWILLSLVMLAGEDRYAATAQFEHTELSAELVEPVLSDPGFQGTVEKLMLLEPELAEELALTVSQHSGSGVGLTASHPQARVAAAAANSAAAEVVARLAGRGEVISIGDFAEIPSRPEGMSPAASVVVVLIGGLVVTAGVVLLAGQRWAMLRRRRP